MIVLASIVLAAFSSFLVMPSWFDHGSYSHSSTHSSLEECQIAKHGMDAICLGDSPSQLYVNDEVEVEGKMEMKFIQCDYFAGCYR
jgi:hypothetical protein